MLQTSAIVVLLLLLLQSEASQMGQDSIDLEGQDAQVAASFPTLHSIHPSFSGRHAPHEISIRERQRAGIAADISRRQGPSICGLMPAL